MPLSLWPMAGLLGGALAGSFLSTAAIRWERGQSVVRGRSRCDACHRTLPPSSLVPIASVLVVRGRCRWCGTRIDPRHLAMELGCAIIGGTSLALQPGVAGVAGALFGWLLALLLLLDLSSLWLPDRVTGPLAGLGLGAGLLGIAPNLDARLFGALGGYAALELVRQGFRRLRGHDGMGGGDPKLLGAIGAWLGWQRLPWVVALAAIAGLAWSAWQSWRGRPIVRTTPLPFGAFLAGAAWAGWLWGAIHPMAALS